jgi:alkylation response protein AidB-like acyl-CoA dehydrogenase
MLNTETRSIYSSEHAIFRSAVRKFLAQEVDPKFERWEQQGCVDREFFKVFGAAGYLCPTVPEQYGGSGASFLYNAILDEELAYYGFWAGTTLQSDITADYLICYGSEEQKAKYLPLMVSGDLITAIAMTEPSAGSDLKGIHTIARPQSPDR